MDPKTLRAITRRLLQAVRLWHRRGGPRGVLDERWFAQNSGDGAHLIACAALRARRRPHISLWPARRADRPVRTTSRPPAEVRGQRIPAEFIPKGERFAFIKGTPRLLGSPFTFKKYGQSGAELSELLPHLASIADEIAIVRSLHTTQFNHAPGQIFMNTGSQVFGRPSVGSWLTYGLGSESRDLPGFVVLLSGEMRPGWRQVVLGKADSSDRLPGVEFRSKGDPVCSSRNPDG